MFVRIRTAVNVSEASRLTLMMPSSTTNYRIVDLITTMFITVFTKVYRIIKIRKAYEEEGITGVVKEVNYIAFSIIREAYRKAGIEIKDIIEINFTELVKARYIDEKTALHLTTLYMAIEADLENLEEASENEINEILSAIVENISEMENILIYSKQYTTERKHSYREEQVSTYVTGSITYM